MNITHLVLLTAAVWRLSNILAHKEEGPFQIFWKPHLWARRAIRKNKNGWFAKSKIKEGMECEYCNSIWFGTLLGVAYLIFGEPVIYVILPLALSAGAILIKHIVFLIKSVDTRYDQQNQSYLEAKAELAKRLNGAQHSTFTPLPPEVLREWSEVHSTKGG